REKLGSFCKNNFFRPVRGSVQFDRGSLVRYMRFPARVSRTFLKSTDHTGGSRYPSATQEHGIRNGPRLSSGWRSHVGARVLIFLATFSPYRRKPVSSCNGSMDPDLRRGGVRV